MGKQNWIKLFLKKLFIGKTNFENIPIHSTFKRRLNNIKSIWNSESDDDIGLERKIRLILATSQLFFLGTYIKEIFHKKGIVYQEIFIDLFVLIKLFLPVVTITYGLQSNIIIYNVLIWFLLETLLYIPTLIFASDIFSKPRSYRRSILLLFLNYLEIIFTFSVIYSRGNHLHGANYWYDYIYFSFVTASTTGYGDIYPITMIGKFLVCLQIIIFVLFVVIFFNFFSTKIGSKGYFDDKNKN